MPGDFNGFLAVEGMIGSGDVANLTSQYADYTYWADFIFQAMFAAKSRYHRFRCGGRTREALRIHALRCDTRWPLSIHRRFVEVGRRLA